MSRVIVAGSINIDVMASVQTLPHAGQTVPGTGLAHHPGGKGANQAVAAARAGAQTAMFGKLGDDEHAGTLEGFLSANGVDAAGVTRVPGAMTGTAVVVVDTDGQNMVVAVPAANALLTPEDLAACTPEPGDVLVAQLETPVETTRAFFEAGRAAGAQTILNAAPAIPFPADLLSLADVVLVNEVELDVYIRQAFGDELADAAVVERARRFRTGPDQSVVVTLGSRGAIAVAGRDVLVFEGHRVAVRDTTGAGDCFVGALAARLAAGESLADGLAFANRAASTCVQRPGAGPSMPLAEEVESAMASPAADASPSQQPTH